MNVIHSTKELVASSRPVCVAIGVFDGVHLGHQEVIRRAVADAARYNGTGLVITFDRHPAAVLAPAHVPPQIQSLPQKLRAIADLGVDTACVIHFDKAFSEIAAEDFVRGLERDCGKLQSLSVGATFVFGRGRGGNVCLLESLGSELNFTLHALAEVSLDGQTVSSTRVREAVSAGDFARANRMLGRPYSLSGLVKKGRGVGRQIGVPTANLETTGLLLPPVGVYSGSAAVNGRTYPAAVNIGFRPTMADSEPSLQVEAHLLDFAEDVYGQEMELTFLEKLRGEEKFPSLAALRDQIQLDLARVRELTIGGKIL